MVHSFADGTTLYCLVSYLTSPGANLHIDCGRCISGVPLDTDLEHVSSQTSSVVTFTSRTYSISFRYPPHISLLIHLFRVPWTLFLFWDYPLVLHCAGLPSDVDLLLTLRALLVFCSAPGISLSQLIFYCTELESISHLNAAALSKKSHSTNRRSSLNIHFAFAIPLSVNCFVIPFLPSLPWFFLFLEACLVPVVFSRSFRTQQPFTLITFLLLCIVLLAFILFPFDF